MPIRFNRMEGRSNDKTRFYNIKNDTMTPLEQHMEVMKKELQHMYQNDIRFGLLLKLIRHAQELIEEEQRAAETKVSIPDGHFLTNIADSYNNFANT